MDIYTSKILRQIEIFDLAYFFDKSDFLFAIYCQNLAIVSKNFAKLSNKIGIRQVKLNERQKYLTMQRDSDTLYLLS